MGSYCYAMLRGSVIRLTRLDSHGLVLEGDRASRVSRNIAKITISEVSDSRPELNEKDDRGDLRLYSPSQAETIRFQADIDLTLTDPDALELATGQPVVVNSTGDVVGWDAKTRVKSAPFALEVWSKLSVEDRMTGYQYGYTLFPFLRGGLLSGTAFSDKHVSFSIKGARTMRNSFWGTGPYVINNNEAHCMPGGFGVVGGFGTLPFDTEPFDLLDSRVNPRVEPVSRNLMWTNQLVDFAPEPTCGAVPLYEGSI